MHVVLILKESEISLVIIYECSDNSQWCVFSGSQQYVNWPFFFLVRALTNFRGVAKVMRKLWLLSY